MRIRKTNSIVGGFLLVGAFFMFYLVVDTYTNSGSNYEDPELQKSQLGDLDVKLRGLENDLLTNQKTIEKIRDTVLELKKEQAVIKEESKAVRAKGKSPVNKTFASIHKSDFGFARSKPAQCQIRMSDVYDKLTFDNPDGGVWKQGWDIQYDAASKMEENKLKVYVMPHSHNDPGWIKTFEQYYMSQTRQILDNMVVKLGENTKRKFVWAEISFFALWWAEQKAEIREKVKKLLADGQLEIVTGGWVMNDEANSYYYAIMEQLILGHEWCKQNLEFKPNNGWAIDPFGMSPTMAYILKRTGFDNMLIQRTHYSVKKHLAKEKNLEFRWRQHWDHDTSTDMVTHMMPFYSYDIPHTCGPDPKVCCQFDFLRLPGSRATCPWRVPPKPITDSNVAERSRTLLDQYRKKSQLYATNALLVPLGDDFRYDTAKEWDAQFQNYEKLFEYINSHPELNAQVQFGTLEDYFSEVRQQLKSKNKELPSLSGDFFTYADREDHYWSGYYTSRPFYKNMDRVLQHHLRSAEILFSMMWAEMEYVGSDFTQLTEPMMEHLLYARQNLALFQHHDGVTGTAKDHVVADYGQKMSDSIHKLQAVMAQAAHYLLTPSKAFYKPQLNTVWFDMDEFRDNHDSLPKQTVIQVEHYDQPNRVVIYNSHARHRSEVVTVRVSESNIKVYKINNVEGDEEEEVVPSQLSPVFDDQGQVINNEFQFSFLAQVKGLALQSYFLKPLRPEEGENPDNDVAHIRIHNSAKHPFQVAPFAEAEVYEVGESFQLQNGYVRCDFSSDGFLQTLTTIDDKIKTDMKLEFVTYGTRSTGDKSGAYLFLPDGKAKPLVPERPYVRIIEGKVLSYVEVITPWFKHTVTLRSSPGADGTGILINNEVDVRRMNNQELAMRISTDLKTGDTFFTDLNGFQMIKRKKLAKLPLQANFYPVPSMAYIQDESSRMTLITRQPLGGSSLAPGQFELMMDRRLMQDDNRGLFQGVTDNKVTPHEFILLLERKTKGCEDEAEDPAASYPSLLAIAARHGLLLPMSRMIFAQPHSSGSTLSKTYKPIDKDLACDIHVVNLRTVSKSAFKIQASDNAALILHRQGFNGCYKPVGMTCATNGGKVSLEELFPELYGDSVKQMSLSLLYEGMKVEKGFTVSIKPMEMYSFLLRR